jgi:NADH:ubiquinone oxidoreductase subunit 3 (subunit A)
MLGPLGAALAVFGATVAATLVLRVLGDAGGVTASERLPFAGGYPPRVHAWSRFHARYYVMAFVFLAFDMEMVYMYPWAVVFAREGAIAFVEMGWFILVLLLGILYAWREGAFEWA